MNAIEESLGLMMIVFVSAAIIQLLLIRRRFNNIADPLLFFAVSSAFSLGLGVYAVDSTYLYARIVVYFLCFYLGFFIAAGRSIEIAQPLKMHQGVHHFKLVLMIGCTLFFLVNMIVWVNSGFIILSADPSLQKSTAYADGFGFVRRINWGLGVFVMMGACYWFLWSRSKTALVWLALAVITSISGGGKSALLPFFFALGLYFLRPFRPALSPGQIPSRRVLVYALLLALVPVSTVLIIENESAVSALSALSVRLFYFGDVLLYWGQPDLRVYFSNLGVWDYLSNSFGSILGLLRLVEYSAPIGNQFIQFTLSPTQEFPDSLGPNLPFYVRGELYFGPWFAPFYAYIVGWIFGRTRRTFIDYRGDNLLHYTLIAFGVYLASTLPIDEALAIARVADFSVVYFLIHYLAWLIILAARRDRYMALDRGK